MDIAAWLRGLGLERYEPAFRENEIDADVLPELTKSHLAALGLPLGTRLKLLKAIAALREAAPAPVAARLPTEAAGIPAAERRQLTIMFCDVVGSTALATRLDAEDLREIIGAYHRAVAEVLTRFGGFVAKYMGDGVLAYFGYPQAHEDDARARGQGGARGHRRGPRPGSSAQPLAVRLGIASGLVVVGDLIGEGAAQERGVVGETPSLAARLQALAAPNTLAISESTRRQVGRPLRDRGFGPATACRLRCAAAGLAGPRRKRRRQPLRGTAPAGDAARRPRRGTRPAPTPLARQAKAGEGRVVLISGEPGIGKSRLTAALVESIGGEPHTRLRYFSSPHHQESALYPFIVQLERAAGFARDDTPEAKLAELEALIAEGAAEPDETTLFAELLSLPNAAAGLE